MPEPYTTTRRVEFSDTDLAGIMHFTAFFRMMEQAEHDFLRAQGLSVYIEDEPGHISWPRVSASCDFTAPAKFEDELQIEVRVTGINEKSLNFQFTITCEGKSLAVGKMTSVCCRILPGQRPRSIPIPAWIREKLE